MKNKCILIGITGGIAAYKVANLVSKLKKEGNDVHVLMSQSAQEFITPLTMQTLSSNKVITDMFTTDYIPEVHHISLAKKADFFVIAPATANVISKIAYGQADDMLTTTFLAARCPKLVVPAMNTGMLENPITQDNLLRLKKFGIAVMDSGDGYLACGDVGSGRLPEPDQIYDAINMYIETKRPLAGKKVLISAGPTQEMIDPVRYITNHSSGKMGYHLAKEARNLGAQVTLVSGPVQLAKPYGIQVIDVVDNEQMYQAMLQQFPTCDICIMAAAVADYKPTIAQSQKIKKQHDQWNLELSKTHDILETLGKQKTHQRLIGFAMETQDLLENAKKKIAKKNCDYIIANSIQEAGSGFGVDTNHVYIISKYDVSEIALMSKQQVAVEILKHCAGVNEYVING